MVNHWIIRIEYGKNFTASKDQFWAVNRQRNNKKCLTMEPGDILWFLCNKNRPNKTDNEVLAIATFSNIVDRTGDTIEQILNRDKLQGWLPTKTGTNPWYLELHYKTKINTIPNNIKIRSNYQDAVIPSYRLPNYDLPNIYTALII